MNNNNKLPDLNLQILYKYRNRMELWDLILGNNQKSLFLYLRNLNKQDLFGKEDLTIEIIEELAEKYYELLGLNKRYDFACTLVFKPFTDANRTTKQIHGVTKRQAENDVRYWINRLNGQFFGHQKAKLNYDSKNFINGKCIESATILEQHKKFDGTHIHCLIKAPVDVKTKWRKKKQDFLRLTFALHMEETIKKTKYGSRIQIKNISNESGWLSYMTKQLGKADIDNVALTTLRPKEVM